MLPITPELLAQMLQCLQQDGSWLAARDACFYALSWFGMLRASEALALQFGSVRVLAEGLELFIPFSKTDQRGDGAFVLLGRLQGSALSPTVAFQRWQEQARRVPGQPLFPVQSGGHSVVKGTMLARMRRLLQRVGLSEQQAKCFGLHSLRRGGATAASRSGQPLRMIMEHGRWTSDCVREYCYADEQERWGMAAAMLAGPRV